MDANGGEQANARTADARALIAPIPKEKTYKDMKGRACMNGAPQQAHIPKENMALPTVSTKLTFITATIAAKARRKVMMCLARLSTRTLMRMWLWFLGRTDQYDDTNSTQGVQEVCGAGQKGDKSPLGKASEGIVWTDADEPTILQEAEEGVQGVGANCESVQSVHNKYGYKSRKATYGNMACWWPDGILWRQLQAHKVFLLSGEHLLAKVEHAPGT